MPLSEIAMSDHHRQTYRQRRASNYADFDNPLFARRLDFWFTWARRFIFIVSVANLPVSLVWWWVR